MTLKTILIIALLFIGFHLLLYGYMRRRISVAKWTMDDKDAKRNSGSDNEH